MPHLLNDEAIEGLDAAQHSVTICDVRRPDVPLVYVNPGFTAFSGYTREEALGRNCRFMQGSDRDQPGVAAIREAISAGESCIVDLINYRKDGGRIHNRLSLHPVFDSSNAVTHFVGLQVNVDALIAVKDRIGLYLEGKGLRLGDLENR